MKKHQAAASSGILTLYNAGTKNGIGA